MARSNAKASSSPVKSESRASPLRESALTAPVVVFARASELAVTPMGLRSATLPASPSNSRPSSNAPSSAATLAPLNSCSGGAAAVAISSVLWL